MASINVNLGPTINYNNNSGNPGGGPGGPGGPGFPPPPGGPGGPGGPGHHHHHHHHHHEAGGSEGGGQQIQPPKDNKLADIATAPLGKLGLSTGDQYQQNYQSYVNAASGVANAGG